MFRKALAVFLVLVFVALSGCSLASPEAQGTVIAASFYPVYIFTMNLVDGIDGVQVLCMAEQNVGCLHDYSITARDAKIAADADVFVINGAGMELFVEDLYRSVDSLNVIDSSVGVELLCGGHSHEGHDHSHEGHDHSHEYNSHIWMSVANACIQVGNIKDGLIKAMPGHKAEIEANYKNYVSILEELSAEIKLVGSRISHIPVMTFHDAYTYLAKDMGLHITGVVESGEGTEPSAKEIAHLADEIESHGVKALFIEPDYTGSVADVLSRETGVSVYTLNPVIKGDAVKSAYEDIMRDNIKTITEAVE